MAENLRSGREFAVASSQDSLSFETVPLPSAFTRTLTF